MVVTGRRQRGLRGCAVRTARDPGRQRGAGLRGPALQHRTVAAGSAPEHGSGARGRRGRLRGPQASPHHRGHPALHRPYRRLPRLAAPVAGRDPARAHPRGHPLPARRLRGSRTTARSCSTSSSAASASSTRSSGPTTTGREHGAAGRPSTTSSWCTSRPAPLPLRRPARWTGSRTWRPGLQTPERAARGKTADRRLVAHHRAHELAGADRVPDPEAARRTPADRRGLVAARRPGARLVCRQRHHWGGGAAASGGAFLLVDSSADAVALMRGSRAVHRARSSSSARPCSAAVVTIGRR